MLNLKKTISFVLCSLILGGCSNDFSGNSYTSSNVGEVAITDTGTIISLRRIEIKKEGSGAGTALGAVGGGIAGAMFGKGSGKLLGSALGAAAGGLVGNVIENKKQEGVEYTVKLYNGSIITLAQGVPPQLSVGQKVYVVNSKKGRSRIVAA